MVRSFLFSLAFLVWSIVCSALLVWCVLLPRSAARYLVRNIYFRFCHVLERAILGLDYAVKGWEHLPASGSYLIAAKHQSAYETLKIHLMFPTTSFVIKQELERIPLWGWLCVKVGGIPIDRSDGNASLKTIRAMAQPALDRGEPILIYPQGTRVPYDATKDDYPYKLGVGLLAKTLDIPVIPMRCDSGLYWPKKGWTNKKSGTVKFEILPPLTGKTAKEIVAQIEEALDVPPQF